MSWLLDAVHRSKTSKLQAEEKIARTFCIRKLSGLPANIKSNPGYGSSYGGETMSLLFDKELDAATVLGTRGRQVYSIFSILMVE